MLDDGLAFRPVLQVPQECRCQSRPLESFARLGSWFHPQQHTPVYGLLPGPLDTGTARWYYITTKVMEVSVESAITVKGQATIPKAIREHLRLKPGDRVKFFVHPDGSVVLLPKLPASALRGIVKSRRRRPVTIEEMTKAAAEGAASAAERAGRR